MVKIYGIKTCGSVKKALTFLDKNNIAYTFIDFKKTPPTQENLDFWLKHTELKKLFNTKGTTYKKLALKDKNLSENEIKDYLLKEPMLIKRPVIECKSGVLVGFDEAIYGSTKW